MHELDGKFFTGYGLELRAVAKADLPTLRRWRNSPQIRCQMVDTTYISPKDQRDWFESILGCDREAHWVARFRDIRAGYMNLKGGGKLSSQLCLDGGLYIGCIIGKTWSPWLCVGLVAVRNFFRTLKSA